MQNRVVEDGFQKNRRAETATAHTEMAELSVFTFLAQSEILTSQTYRMSFAKALLTSCLKVLFVLSHVMLYRGSNKTAEWLTCSPAT